jgi:riboflavin transporter FmnP
MPARYKNGAIAELHLMGMADRMATALLRWLHALVRRHLRAIELVGVLMRIFSFSLVSWLGPRSPFLFVWAFNTADAVMLSWCAIIKRDVAYSILNIFWVGVGIVGMIRAAGFAHP